MWEGTDHTDFLAALEVFAGIANLFRLSGRGH